MGRLGQEGLPDITHQPNAKLAFRTTLRRDATGHGLYLQVEHTRAERRPLRRKGGIV